jgi:hypothetical protein
MLRTEQLLDSGVAREISSVAHRAFDMPFPGVDPKKDADAVPRSPPTLPCGWKSSWPSAEACRSGAAEAYCDHLLWFTSRNDNSPALPGIPGSLLSQSYIVK